MQSFIERIISDLMVLSEAVAVSQKNPYFVFVEIFYLIASLILVLFITALGRRIFHWFNLKVYLVEELLFSLGLGIIFWGTLVLILGMLGILYFWVVWGVFGILSVACWPETVWVIREIREKKSNLRKDRFNKILIFFLIAFVFLNLIGALTPEKGVDAIGYHLYFPKVYLQEHTMMLPARGSRLFSLFPHLASMIYLLPVSLNLPNVAQLFHFWLGIFSAITIASIVEKKFKDRGLLASLFFYSTLVVGSISRSAYSDFFVTFFLSLVVLGWVRVIGENERGWGKWGIITGLMLGGALATKNQTLALLPLILLSSLITGNKYFRTRLLMILRLFLIFLSVPFLWYLRSFLVSGSPFYPMFVLRQARVPELSIKFINVINVIKSTALIQPVFILIFLGFLLLRKEKKIILSLAISLLIFLYWLFLPASFHDNRYFLPYLLLIIIAIHPVTEELFRRSFFMFGMLGMLGVLFIPRFYTNSLYLPYVFGFENKKVFLSQALKNKTEDFYDINGIFSRVIKGEKRDIGDMENMGELRNMREIKGGKVLVDNVLGLYYLDFPFSEFEYSSFYGKKLTENEFKIIWKENHYSYVLLKNETLSDFFVKMGLVGNNEKLFTLSVFHLPSKTYLYKPNFL